MKSRVSKTSSVSVKASRSGPSSVLSATRQTDRCCIPNWSLALQVARELKAISQTSQCRCEYPNVPKSNRIARALFWSHFAKQTPPGRVGCDPDLAPDSAPRQSSRMADPDDRKRPTQKLFRG